VKNTFIKKGGGSIYACIVVHPIYKGDKLFDLNDSTLNRDNCLLPFVKLKQRFLKEGIELLAVAEGEEKEFSIVIYNEMPKSIVNSNPIQSRYLMIFESELVIPSNWQTELHKNFNRIFTWHDDVVQGDKYIKFNFPQNISQHLKLPDIQKTKFCALIAGNKSVQHPLEFYSERRNAIRWFKEKHPDQFDLYGIGWDAFSSSSKLLNKLVRLCKLSKLLAPNYQSYKGKVESKNATLQAYKYSICYENAKDIPGYITEKIFDCFFAGCVPIYWGANNIEEHIPKHCFIDKRDFSSYEELYVYMANMAEEEYKRYQDNITDFLNSEQAQLFSAEHFAETIVQTINKDLNCE
jgi:hypothetical protein